MTSWKTKQVQDRLKDAYGKENVKAPDSLKQKIQNDINKKK